MNAVYKGQNYCVLCNKYFKHLSSLVRHKNNCYNNQTKFDEMKEMKEMKEINENTIKTISNDSCQNIISNYENDGINGCISSLSDYLKKSAMQQYKDMNGKDIEMNNIILPFLLSDKSLREHFEKNDNGNWDKTTMIDNIKKIISITSDHVYKYHKKHMAFNGSQKKRIINGLLKASGYSMLSHLSIPDLYKIENDKTIDVKDEKNNDNEYDSNDVLDYELY